MDATIMEGLFSSMGAEMQSMDPGDFCGGEGADYAVTTCHPSNFHQHPSTIAGISGAHSGLLSQSNYGNPTMFNNQQNQYTYPLTYLLCQADQPQSCQQNRNGKLQSGRSHQPRSFQTQEEYLQWLDQVQGIQQQLEPIKRPWWLLFIAIADIFGAVLRAIMLVHTLLTEYITSPDLFVIQFVSATIDIILSSLMGGGLLAGIRTDDDTSTLWYCKVWVKFQLLYVMTSFIQAFFMLLKFTEDPFLLWAFRFVYRCASLFLVKLFVGRLKESERLTQVQIGEASLTECRNVE